MLFIARVHVSLVVRQSMLDETAEDMAAELVTAKKELYPQHGKQWWEEDAGVGGESKLI